VADYFEMYNGVQESDSDTDLGSGGAILLPEMKDSSGTTWYLAAGAGKRFQPLCSESQLDGKVQSE